MNRSLFAKSLVNVAAAALLAPLGAPATRASDAHTPAPAPHAATPAPAPDAVVRQLSDGNTRFVTNRPAHPNTDAARRADTANNGQHPAATILTCSDSRVSPEIVFDQGIGDVFVVRVAGNVCDVDEMGSVEYGTDHLGTPLLVVLGHTKCGAVTAIVESAEVHGHIPQLVDNIAPAVEKAQADHPDLQGKALVPQATKANVWQSVEDLLTKSAAVHKRVKSGKLKIVGAVYDISSGKVEWMGAHPQQKMFLEQEVAEQHEGEHGTVTHGKSSHGSGGKSPVASAGLVLVGLGIGLIGGMVTAKPRPKELAAEQHEA